MLSHFIRVQLSATLLTIAHQAPLSIEFSGQEYWSGLSFPSPGDLPNSGIKPVSLLFPALVGGFFTTSTTWEAESNNTHGNLKLQNITQWLFPTYICWNINNQSYNNNEKKNSSHSLKGLLYKIEHVTHWDKMIKVTYLSWLISTALLNSK